MGQFRLEITASGGHGCQREVKDGGIVWGCRRQGCPDCEFWSMVVEFQRRTGCIVETAREVHWPGTSNEVVDVLDTTTIPGTNFQSLSIAPRRRTGSF